jgi:hypothetical protein
LKVYFTTIRLLIHADLSKPFVLEIDIFDFAIAAMLPQLGEDNLLHLVGFCSHKFYSTNIDYKIHD